MLIDGPKRLMSPPTSLFDLRDGRPERIYAGIIYIAPYII